ncbi:MAG: hypothetical protein NC347_13980 [Clostridium sp.]|nr:hypothetical protein [Clostridium sp.]
MNRMNANLTCKINQKGELRKINMNKWRRKTMPEAAVIELLQPYFLERM